jgi:hypothetical protein
MHNSSTEALLYALVVHKVVHNLVVVAVNDLRYLQAEASAVVDGVCLRAGGGGGVILSKYRMLLPYPLTHRSVPAAMA